MSRQPVRRKDFPKHYGSDPLKTTGAIVEDSVRKGVMDSIAVLNCS